MTVDSNLTKAIFACSLEAVSVIMHKSLRVQILPSVSDLSRARKHQFAALLAKEQILVVWDDDIDHVVQRAKEIEGELMNIVWKLGEPEENDEEIIRKATSHNTLKLGIDQESGVTKSQSRPTHLLNTCLVGLTLVLIVAVLGAGFRELAIEIDVDLNYGRLAFVALTPIQIFFTLVRVLTTSSLIL